MKFYRCDDWNDLVGAEVAIHRNGRLFRVGIVDAVMPNGNVLWLAPDYGGERAIYESAEGYEVWLDPDGQSKP